MIKSIYTIATSQDHWTSPFVYKDKTAKFPCTYELTTREKIIVVALAVLTLPTIVGAIFSFYISTAYFKNRALKQMRYGLSVEGKCRTTNQDIRIHYGFGLFYPPKIEVCKCCQRNILFAKFILEHCSFSYEGTEFCKTCKLESQVWVEHQQIEGIKEFSLYFDKMWRYLAIQVDPLPPRSLISL